MNDSKKRLKVFSSRGPTFLLVFMLVVFTLYVGYLALNLQTNILPDETAHFTLSKHFSNTWGIPSDIRQTYSLGIYIEQNPFLYYWITGRVINAVDIIKPEVTVWQTLMTLRIFNGLLALGTVFFCYLLSREVIHHPWWGLLPVFLLTNTLMFVFLAAGVNRDNLANLFCMAGLYYLARVFTSKKFLFNSMMWIVLIALSALVEYTVLPLALAMTVAWLLYVVFNRKELKPLHFDGVKTILLVFVLLSLIICNFLIYGVNLIRFQALIPECDDILLSYQCEISPHFQRYQEMAIKPKMTIRESIGKGYPGLLMYAVDTWVQNMLLRTFGMIGHKSYFPLQLIIPYSILFYGTALISLLLWRRSSPLTYSLIGITIFYALVLLYKNYGSELEYGFIHIALQGRYIFPVIGPIFILFSKVAKNIPFRILQFLFVVFAVGLFIIGGPLTIFLKYHEVFTNWFV